MRLFSLILILLITAPVKAATLMIVGDSLSAGYQMAIEKAWPSLLPDVLADKNQPLDVVNASISGDTSGNGLERLPGLLSQHSPDYVLFELGANDGLRGFPPNLIENNLNQMIELAKKSGATPILMQIHILPNYGKRYTEAFAAVYPKVADQQGIALIPFFLDQVITHPGWMKDDGLHPNAEAQPWIANFVADQLINHLELP